MNMYRYKRGREGEEKRRKGETVVTASTIIVVIDDINIQISERNLYIS